MKRRLKNILMDYFMVNLGTILTAAGIALFLAPAKIASGGVSGVSIIINYLTGFPVGMIMLAINVPIFLLGLKVFGKAYGFKTFFGTVMLSVYVDLITYLVPDINLLIDFSKGSNYLLAPIYGGVLVGGGIGLIMKFGGSTGGTDIIAQILHKYTKISVGNAMMSVDFIVLSSAAMIFGFEKALYAIIALYTMGIVINKVLEGVSHSKMVYIISDHFEEIKEIVLNDLGRGGNAIRADGLYTNQERKMIMTVVGNKDIHVLTELIKEVDSKAFVIISEVYEVLGEGFSPMIADEQKK